MAIKEAKNLELLPRLSANEKRVFTALTKYGVGTALEIAQRSSISKGRVPAVLEAMAQRGFVIPLKADDEGNRRYEECRTPEQGERDAREGLPPVGPVDRCRVEDLVG